MSQDKSMKRYVVYVREIHLVPVEVLAVSIEDARNRANERIESGDIEYSDYSHTCEQDEWHCVLIKREEA